ncbi:tyrosine-type recombinase/integrase [Pseudonocardia alni subsp. carboxydivorans]|uniref:Tyrosine-type recombinase/integrase n=1 Tax=Pseudonocardia alni subsp. carboxydivorans TaxID=415010 RepID=A0ABU9AM42_PSEA5
METSYDVRIWKVEVYSGARTTTHTVKWSVAGRRWRVPYKTAALADAFRSELLVAARRGEAFSLDTGRPMSMDRSERRVGWLAFARDYAAMKWPHLAPNSRRNTARALTNATLALITSERGRPDDATLRKALTAWAFNVRASTNAAPPEPIARALAWLERNTREVGDLAEPAVVRAVLDALTVRGDGGRAAPASIARQRGVVVNLGEYAVERRLLTRNPVTAIAWKIPRTVKTVDKRAVVNTVQARALLSAVGSQKPSGPGLVAFFGLLYYAALRPGEAVTLRAADLQLPAEGWGELLLTGSTPEAGASWTDNGRRREERELKHRARGETRSVPSPPPLTALLRAHLAEHGTTPDGRLFRGVRGGDLPEGTYCRVWRKARASALTESEAASPLARRPYDLRHAAVSTWLNAGVPSTQVAEWAGHSVAVLHQIYAKCIVGQEDAARQRIADALGATP